MLEKSKTFLYQFDASGDLTHIFIVEKSICE